MQSSTKVSQPITQTSGLKLLFIDPASRILEQFGGADKTAGPSALIETQAEDAESPDAENEDESQAESYEDEAPEEVEDDAPELGADSEPDEPDPSEQKIELPDPSQIKIPKSGVGAEVLILLVAVVILFGAIGLAVFLYL